MTCKRNLSTSIYVICRSLVQAHSYGSCFQSTFPQIPSNFRQDKADGYLSRLELINKCTQNIAVPKAKAIQSRSLVNETSKHTKREATPEKTREEILLTHAAFSSLYTYVRDYQNRKTVTRYTNGCLKRLVRQQAQNIKVSFQQKARSNADMRLV